MAVATLLGLAAPFAHGVTYTPLVWIDPFTEGGPTFSNSSYLTGGVPVTYGPYASVLGGTRTVSASYANSFGGGVRWFVSPSTPQGSAGFQIGANTIATANMLWDAGGNGLAPGSLMPTGAEGLAFTGVSIMTANRLPSTLYVQLTDVFGHTAKVGNTISPLLLPGTTPSPITFSYADFLVANPAIALDSIRSVLVTYTGNTLNSDITISGNLGAFYVYGTGSSSGTGSVGTTGGGLTGGSGGLTGGGGGSGITALVPEPGSRTLAPLGWLLALGFLVVRRAA